MSHSEIIRPLGHMEYTYWIMDLASRTNFSTIAHLSGSLPEEVIEKALAAVRDRHPLLRARIVPDAKLGAVFMSCSLPIPLTVSSVPRPRDRFAGHDDPFVRFLQKEQNRGLDSEQGPLMAVAAADHDDASQSIVFTIHHSIADGICGAWLVRDVLGAARDILKGNKVALALQPEAGPLEHRIPRQHRGARGLLRMAGHTLGLNLHRAVSRPVDASTVKRVWADKRRDRFILTSLDAKHTTALMEKAKANGCSVHAALTAAQLMAIAEQYPKKRKTRVVQLSLVDLRKRFEKPVSPDTLTMMISMAETSHSLGEGVKLWGLAREIRGKLQRRISKGFHFFYFPWLCRILYLTRSTRTPDEKGSRKMLRQGDGSRPMVIPVSNIGRLDIPENFEVFSLDGLHFGMAMSSSGLFGSSANTFSGRLFWNFSYAKPSVHPDPAETMAERAVTIIKENIL